MPHLDTFQAYPLTGSPFSIAQLKKAELRGPLLSALKFNQLQDVVFWRDDFLLKALDTTNVYTAAAGASATTWAQQTTIEDGTILGVIGTTAATSALELSIPNTVFAGARNYGCEVRWKTDVVTELRAEIGFVDALPSVNTNIVNSLSTPSFNTTAKACIALFDNASSTNTAGLYCIGASPSVAANKTATTVYPTAATYQTVRLQVNGGKAAMWIDGVLVAQPSADAVGSADLMRFAMNFKGSDTNAKNIQIDYIAVWKDRNN